MALNWSTKQSWIDERLFIEIDRVSLWGGGIDKNYDRGCYLRQTWHQLEAYLLQETQFYSKQISIKHLTILADGKNFMLGR